MPYKKTGTAITHYLRLLEKIAEKYGNPFILAYLPDPVVIEDKKYARDTISRYISWIKRVYREHGRNPPIEVSYVRDRKRGKVSAIRVNLDRLEGEYQWLSSLSDRWPSSTGTKKNTTTPLQCREAVNVIRKLVNVSPEMVSECIDNDEDVVCGIIRLVLDAAITEYNGIAPIEFIMGDVSDEYLDKIKKIKEKVVEWLDGLHG